MALVGLGVLISTGSRWRDLAAGGALVLGGVVALGWLRDQTMLGAALAVVLVSPIVATRHRGARVSGASAIFLVVPYWCGLGMGGWLLVERAVPSLAATRAYMSMNADSAFTPVTIIEPAASSDAVAIQAPVSSTTVPIARGTGGQPRPAAVVTTKVATALPAATTNVATAPPAVTTTVAASPLAVATTVATTTTTTVVVEPDQLVLPDRGGRLYIVDDTVLAGISAIPRDLVATALRPLPWEPSGNASLAMARVENLLWYLLYALGLLGTVMNLRHLRLIAFPLVYSAVILGIASLSQGNIGTAFRHRGQISWSLCLLASLGVSWLLSLRSDRAEARRRRLSIG